MVEKILQKLQDQKKMEIRMKKRENVNGICKRLGIAASIKKEGPRITFQKVDNKGNYDIY